MTYDLFWFILHPVLEDLMSAWFMFCAVSAICYAFLKEWVF